MRSLWLACMVQRRVYHAIIYLYFLERRVLKAVGTTSYDEVWWWFRGVYSTTQYCFRSCRSFIALGGHPRNKEV